MYLICLMSLECFAPIYKTLYIVEASSIEYLSLEDVEKLLIDNNIQYPEIVLAQIRLETGNLSSNICKNNKNLFGMKLPKKRETTAIGEQFGHANYANYSDSVKDYALWQQSRYKGGDYYAFLEDIGYAQDKEYINKLKQFS